MLEQNAICAEDIFGQLFESVVSMDENLARDEDGKFRGGKVLSHLSQTLKMTKIP